MPFGTYVATFQCIFLHTVTFHGLKQMKQRKNKKKKKESKNWCETKFNFELPVK